jgi:hypothetical protein
VNRAAEDPAVVRVGEDSGAVARGAAATTIAVTEGNVGNVERGVIANGRTADRHSAVMLPKLHQFLINELASISHFFCHFSPLQIGLRRLDVSLCVKGLFREMAGDEQ